MVDKRCIACNELLDENLFQLVDKIRGRRLNRCKKCVNVYQKKWVHSNPFKRAAVRKRYSQKHRATENAYALQWRHSKIKADPHTYYAKRRAYLKKRWATDRVRNDTLKYKFGITLEEYNLKLEAHGGGCEICGRKQPVGGRAFPVDHDHTTGQIRGILCNQCNLVLGHFKEDVSRILKTAEYVIKYKQLSKETPLCQTRIPPVSPSTASSACTPQAATS